MLKQYIQEAIQGFKAPKESCSCGCNTCDDASPKLALLETKTPISEGLRYHIENGISLQDNVFRMGSKKYLQLFSEARMLNEWKNISLDENSKFLIENTDIGKFGIHETVNFEGEEYDIISKDGDWVYLRSIHDTMVGKKEIKVKEKDITINEAKVPLDLPMLNEWDLEEAKKKKKKDPPIGKPKRSSSGGKAYKVFVRDPKTKKVKTVRFGSGGLRAKIKDPKARKAFAARHDCKNKKDRTKASYWSCNLPRYAPALGLGPKMNTFW